MGLNDIKSRLSNFSTSPSLRKIAGTSEEEAPSPSIPLIRGRTLSSSTNTGSRREATIFIDARHKHAVAEGFCPDSSVLPDSPTFDFEPLIDDIATETIPEEYAPASGVDSAAELDPSTVRDSRDTMFAPYDVPSRDRSPVKFARSRATPLMTPELKDPVRSESFSRTQLPFKEESYPAWRDLEATSPQTQTSNLRSSRDSSHSEQSYETRASSVMTTNTLPPLQMKSAAPDVERLEPLMEDDPASFDLVPPPDEGRKVFDLEERSQQMFSREHLLEIFKDTPMLLQFINFLNSQRPQSVPLLVYYLDALKALRAIRYANAVCEALTEIEGHSFSAHPTQSTVNKALEEKMNSAFDAMVKDDLPAFVTHTFIRVVSISIQRRITGTLPAHLRESSEGLAEVFCLTDPSRQDNPIVFASEEFHRTTQYGVSYAIGRNCRFLQGPMTNKYSVDRLRAAIHERREVSEVFLNYRRDGSPFMNLLMVAPLLDSKGVARYFIGAQVDVSGLSKDATDLPGLRRLIERQEAARNGEEGKEDDEEKETFQELAEMFNETELNIVCKSGGRMHKEQLDGGSEVIKRADRPRLLIKEPSDSIYQQQQMAPLSYKNGRLEGIYQNYLLVRPYPSLRILFCSPSLRVPGILQSPFLSRIGGSSRVRDSLTAALADGRGVTAKVRWISGRNGIEEGRSKWIHCTPLLGHSGAVGVWMIVLVEDQSSVPMRRFRPPPPIPTDLGPTHSRGRREGRSESSMEAQSLSRAESRAQRFDMREAERTLSRSPTRTRPGTAQTRLIADGGSVESFTIEPL